MEILTELQSDKRPDLSIKVNGKKLDLQVITLKKLLTFEDYMQRFTEGEISLEIFNDFIAFLVKDVFVKSEASDFADMNPRWFIDLSTAIRKAMDIVGGSKDLKAPVKQPEGLKEATSLKQSQGSQGSTITSSKKS